MTKGPLEKFIDKHFKGSYWDAANEMVVTFCEKYHIAGSANGWDFYEDLHEVWKRELGAERARIAEEIRLNKEWEATR